jgi:hypothetical protein
MNAILTETRLIVVSNLTQAGEAHPPEFILDLNHRSEILAECIQNAF